ncbi:hypothetical protein ABTY61_28255 [Kitasatospora sp. NPDC096128]|uniref:hypothetical protein n=1 Tax=Kitasatospora sp. NPDC096128 TaxID=3155547 RepID=UPI003328A22E
MRSELLHHYPELWDPLPAYRSYRRDGALRCLDSLETLLRKSGCFPDHADAFEATVGFVERAFAAYRGGAGGEAGALDWAFVVPSRMADGDALHVDEFSDFLPLLHPRFGADAWVVRRLLSLLPPALLCRYEGGSWAGGVVLAPVNGGLAADVGQQRVRSAAQAVAQDTAEFCRSALGATVVGLGATLPGLTDFGRSIAVPGLVTTTGHGGTVELIRALARDVVQKRFVNESLAVGVVGAAGSIGASILDALRREFPDVPILACDRPSRLGRVERVAARTGVAGRVRVTDRVGEVFASCRLVVSAITERLDLERVAAGVDLAGTVLIDDSQPGCVDRTQWEERGGVLLWPVGSTAHVPGVPRRGAGYRYGALAGLAEPHDVWGCEAEAAAIALTGAHDAALRGPVTAAAGGRIGALCEAVGVRAARPQSFGRPARLPARVLHEAEPDHASPSVVKGKDSARP